MRVGIFLQKRLAHYSIDFDGYAREIALAGHVPVMVCAGNDRGAADFAIVESGDAQQRSADFWKEQRLDLIICFTWLKSPDILKAMRDAGSFVLSRVDSDGLFSYRVNPREHFLRLVKPAKSAADALRRIRHFLRCYFSFYKEWDAETLEAFELSDAVVFETEESKKHMTRFLRHYGREDLAARIHVVPHAVPDYFLDAPVGGTDRKYVFCAGRWDDDQKDAALLAATIAKVLERDPSVHFVLAGYGVKEAFRDVASRHPQVEVRGLIPRTELPAVLAECFFILSSSRWESHPIGALEILCCGGTVVGTPIPGFIDIVHGDEYGATSRRHSDVSLAEATLMELDRWKEGKRKPIEIATHWRRVVNNKVVVRKLLETHAQRSD